MRRVCAAITAAILAATLVAPDRLAAADPGDDPPPIEVELAPLPDVPVPATAGSSLTPAAATPGTRYAGFVPLASPERLLDTRVANGVPFAVPLGPGETYTVRLAGRGSVPADATAVVMNVTADAPSAGGYVTVYPAGQGVPGTSNLNIVPGKTVPNLVVVALGGGQASFFNAFGTTHLIADVLAYSRADGHFVGSTPTRFLDTRTGVGAPAAKLGPGGRIDVDVRGRGTVPTDAARIGAVVVNITADQPTAASFVTAWPSGVARPDASSLNFAPGQTVANLVFAPVGADGRVSFFNESGETHLIGDVVGWIPSGAAYVPVTPTRVLDTRTGLGRLAALGEDPASTAPLGPGASILFAPYSSAVPGTLSSDTTIAGYVLNVTAAGPTDKSFLTVYPWGQALPNASNLNTTAGENVPNAVMVRPGLAGVDVIRNEAGWTHVIVDVVGIVPRHNAADAPDDRGGSRFHVVYLLGSDSTANPSMPALIREELEAANTWMASETPGAARLDFARTGGQIDVTTWRLSDWTQAQLVSWETRTEIIGGYVFYELPLQLLEDGFGYPANHKVLVYIEGDRNDGVCGLTWGQYATLFTSLSGCMMTVNGALEDVGSTPNTELVALHEAFHALGAVPTCGANSNGGSHSTVSSDLMYPSVQPSFPKHIDAARSTYFRGNGGSCRDLALSPYLSTVPG